MSESVLASHFTSPTRSPAPGRPVLHDPIAFAAANAWIRAARVCRLDIEPLFLAAGVEMSPTGTFHVRKQSLVTLMQQCVWRAAPEAHFPLIMGDSFAFDHLPAFDTFLSTTPTLRQALPALRWAGVALPSLTLTLEEFPATSALIIEVDLPSENTRVLGYFVEAVLAGLNKVVRMAVGDMSTVVSHIDVRHDPGPQKLACERLLQLPIRVNQPRNAVVFNSQLLDTPLPGAVPGLHRKAHELIEQQLPAAVNPKLSDQLERAFHQSPSLLGQGIERMARRLELHPRTLQRRLREEGQLFADIQARCRFEMAATTLKSSTCDIESLSDRLGFSDRHSFTRAFKRWTGLAPSEFREQHLQQKTETKT
jgi:AraC-like DNA-binding protein